MRPRPQLISVMEAALDAAAASLPEPVHSGHVQAIAETILRAAHAGEARSHPNGSHCWSCSSFSVNCPACRQGRRLLLPPRGSIHPPMTEPLLGRSIDRVEHERFVRGRA